MKLFSAISNISSCFRGSSESGVSRSPTQEQQHEPTTLITLLPELKLDIVQRLDQTAKRNLRLTCKAFNPIVKETFTHVRVSNREDFLAAINAYKAGSITTLTINTHALASKLNDDDILLLQDLPKLKRLKLFSCADLTDAGLAHLQHLPALEQLSLGGCPKLIDAGLASLQYLPALRKLDLSECKLTDAEFASLPHLPALKQLDLSWCKLTDAGLAHLQHYPALWKLNLSGCTMLTEPGLAQLQHHPSLSWLIFKHCHDYFTFEQESRLRDQFRDCGKHLTTRY